MQVDHNRPQPAGTPSPRLPWRMGVFVTILTLIAYGQVIGFEFTNYDDPDYASGNPVLRQGITWDSTYWAWTTFFAGNWHPLTWMSHALDWQMFGGSPGAHHLVNLTIHLVNIWLVLVVIGRWTTSVTAGVCVAGLVALHPINVESVAWVAERKNLLSTLFLWLTLLAWHEFQIRRTRRWHAMALLFMALGLMSKAMLVTLPFVLLLLDVWPYGHWSTPCAPQNFKRMRRLVCEKLPFFALSAASCAITLHAAHAGGAMESLEKYPMVARYLNAVVSYAGYLVKGVWPTSLSVLYPHPGMRPWMEVLGAGAAIAAISIPAIRQLRDRPWIFTGWCWFLGTLVPVIGLVQVSAHSLANRYAYVSMVGVFMATVLGARELWVRRNLPYAWARRLAALAGMVLAIATWRQAGHWRNSVTLFSHAAAVTRSNSIACYNLAQALTVRGSFAEAVPWYEKALEFNPRYMAAHSNLGYLLVLRGDFVAGAHHYAAALKEEPDNGNANFNAGALALRQGKAMEAARHFLVSARETWDSDLVQLHLARALDMVGQTNLARRHFREALRLNPENEEARLGLVNLTAAPGP